MHIQITSVWFQLMTIPEVPDTFMKSFTKNCTRVTPAYSKETKKLLKSIHTLKTFVVSAFPEFLANGLVKNDETPPKLDET